ncbi:hypothetical protein SRB5_61130 [Streptomyces sp. RB5]|uniref:Uncharacterized protein n=1 Tax=Streptomyces smaragdinus TaxID=2585196 RepID=A0A7K0CR80_9ACTN|nr:hypothetical protein [Streptomyces smaragdinus]MQY15921.1 hypothetical protein [Streptomyces smaragdinus]
MAIVRFSVSMPSEVRDRIKAHAAAANLDVSAFLAVAAVAQMDAQDRVGRILAPFEEARAEAEAAAADAAADSWTDGMVLTAEEQAEVNRILGRPPADGGGATAA